MKKVRTLLKKGFEITGFILERGDESCLIDSGATRRLSSEELFKLMMSIK